VVEAAVVTVADAAATVVGVGDAAEVVEVAVVIEVAIGVGIAAIAETAGKRVFLGLTGTLR
jgi:hypothetical protein